MSLRPRLVPDIPEETARIAKEAFRKGNPYLNMRDTLGTFFNDEQFLELYPLDGQPAFSPLRFNHAVNIKIGSKISMFWVSPCVSTNKYGKSSPFFVFFLKWLEKWRRFPSTAY